MDLPNVDVDLIAIVVGAVIGSFKASVEFNKDKRFFARSLDIVLGVFCGVMLAHHFNNQGSAALSGILALVGGVSGAVVIEVFMQMLPSIVRKAIKSMVDKNVE